MNPDIQNVITQFNSDIQDCFALLRTLIIQSVTDEVDERLWAKSPSFYVETYFVRIIPFKDHLNIEATAIQAYQHLLKDFKITPKGMLQVYPKQ